MVITLMVDNDLSCNDTYAVMTPFFALLPRAMTLSIRCTLAAFIYSTRRVLSLVFGVISKIFKILKSEFR